VSLSTSIQKNSRGLHQSPTLVAFLTRTLFHASVIPGKISPAKCITGYEVSYFNGGRIYRDMLKMERISITINTLLQVNRKGMKYEEKLEQDPH